MFTGWMTSPIKGKLNHIYGYAVVQGYGKDRQTALASMLPDHTLDTAYEAASDLAALLNATDYVASISEREHE